MLKLLIIAFITILFISILLYMMSIRIKFKTKRVKDDDVIIIRVKTLYGIVNLNFEIPFLDIVFINNRLALKYKAEVESNKTNKLFKKISKVFTVEDFNNIKKYFHHDPVLLKKLKNYWSRKLSIHDFSLILTYGTEDAALSALIYGLLWGIIGSLLSILSNNLIFSTKDILITPYYNREEVNFEFSCIIKFKFGDIINTGIMLFRRNIQQKKLSIS